MVYVCYKFRIYECCIFMRKLDVIGYSMTTVQLSTDIYKTNRQT